MLLPGPASDQARALAGALGLSVTVADVLHRRGLSDLDALRRWLEPRLAHLSAPDAMLDRAPAARRIADAVRAKERIVVFGDYDCDGITATAVLTEFLRGVGAEVVPLLASRWSGGYGLSDPAVDRVLAAGASLLITCDCGSSDAARLARVRAAGLDAVVIDHHLVPPEPLPVVAFLNPHRPGCGFAFKGLASCGLALSVVAAVRAELGAGGDLRPLLDLVAIGTIADVAPLDGDNRPLVRTGLDVLARAGRPGVAALAAVGGLDLARGLGARDVAFRFAPRINAPGRIGAPDVALALLLERDPARARALATEVEQAQVRRREIEKGVLDAALAQVAASDWADAPGLVVAGQGWSQGVVGIVAGRLASRLGKPTVVIGLDGATGRGSARAPRGFRLYDALAASRETLVGFGGHQAAAGVEVEAERVEAFRARFAAACEAGTDGHAGAEEPEAHVLLDAADDPARVVADLARLEPCGEANPAPRIALAGALVRSAREVRGGHLKLTLDVAGRSVGGFGPELGARAATLRGHVHVVGRLRRDGYRGGDAVEIEVERIEPA